ncbi:MAG: helix-turn-helix domain-containing protein [Lachnospiraceae bacterium]|nr:helix-turn-helix domain-containing protein [Lachnospiraceae bacterium]
MSQVQEQKFAKILRNERKKAGLSQAQLAEMTGLSVRTISLWENGRRKMTLENADKVFRALHVSVAIGEEM